MPIGWISLLFARILGYSVVRLETMTTMFMNIIVAVLETVRKTERSYQWPV